VYDEGALVGLCTQDYNCRCAGVMTCATMLTPETLENRSNRGVNLSVGASRSDAHVVQILWPRVSYLCTNNPHIRYFLQWPKNPVK